MRYRAVVMTNLGRVRRNNEDNFYFNGRFHDIDEDLSDYTATLQPTTEVGLFAICDGMGGEALGEQAAYIAVSGLPELERMLRERPDISLEEIANSYLIRTNDILCQQMRWNDGVRMGTTFSALLLRDDTAQTVNLGDSRVFLVREGQLFQLTRDHTHAQRLQDLGIITREESLTHPERHRLTQHLGLFPEERHLNPSYSSQFWLQENDLLLLTSDGITDMVDGDDLLGLIDPELTLRDQAGAIMKQALENGGRDNATLIVIRIEAVKPRDTRGIRETSGIVITPPEAPINPERDEDTKPIPVLPHYLYAAGPAQGSEELPTDARENADSERAPDEVKPIGAAEKPEDHSAARTAKRDEPGRELPIPAEDEPPFPADLQSEPPVIVRHTAELPAQSVHKKQKEEESLSPVRRLQLQNEAVLAERSTSLHALSLQKRSDTDRCSPLQDQTDTDTKRLSDVQEVQGDKMKRKMNPDQPVQNIDRPIQRKDVRRAVPTDKNGLTQADLERFRKAQEAARIRRAEHLAGEAQYTDAPVLPGHSSRVSSAASQSTMRFQTGGRRAEGAERRRPPAPGSLSEDPRRRAARPQGRTETSIRRAGDRPQSKEDLSRRRPQHNVGREVPASVTRVSADGSAAPAGGKAHRRFGGFWKNFLFFIIFAIIGFLIGWVLLNVGKFF